MVSEADKKVLGVMKEFGPGLASRVVLAREIVRIRDGLYVALAALRDDAPAEARDTASNHVRGLLPLTPLTSVSAPTPQDTENA